MTDRDAHSLIERAVACARARHSRRARALAGAAVEAWRLAEEAAGQDGHDRLLGRSAMLAAEMLAASTEGPGDARLGGLGFR